MGGGDFVGALAGDEFFVDFSKQGGEDNSGETAAQWASLGEAFALFEVSGCASVGFAPAPVWFFADLIEAWDHVF